MTEMLLEANTLPEPLARLIHTKQVKICESHGKIQLIPMEDTAVDCPLHGLFADGKISVDKFIADKHTEKELEL